MTTYTIVVSDEQMKMIEQALKMLQRVNQTDPLMEEEEADELDILVSMAESIEEDNKEDPDMIHGWCY